MYGYAINCGWGPSGSCAPRSGRRRHRGWQNAAWPVQVWAAAQQAARQAQPQGWMPGIDVSENAQVYRLSIDLPGVDRQDIHVELEDGKLSLTAERKQPQEAEGEQWHWRGRRYGSFRRSFQLPRTVDADNIAAEYRDGVLHLTLPKSETTLARQVSIN